MNDDFLTEENKPKKNIKKILLTILFIVFIGLVVYGLFTFISNKKAEEERKKKEIKEENLLNGELSGIKYFGISNNYIVGISDDLNSINVYNLMQGTGQFGDFKDYIYYDKNLYLIFSDNSVYKISLTSGNRVYELTRFLSLDYNPTFITFLTKNNIIVSDGKNINLIKKGDKKDEVSTLITFNNINKIIYSNKALYVLDNNTLYKYDLTNNTNTKLYDNINDIKLYDNILVIKSGNSFTGLNTKNNNSMVLSQNAKDVGITKNNVYSLLNDGIYSVKTGKKIYAVHYNNLDNLNVIGSYLEVVDNDTEDDTKARNIYINTKNKNESSIGDNLYTNIKEYTK